MQYKNFVRRNNNAPQPYVARPDYYQKPAAPAPKPNAVSPIKPAQNRFEFEVFERNSKRGRQLTINPYVNIYQNKFIYFRGGLIRDIFKDKIPEHVYIQLLYCKKTNSIGFLFLKDKPQEESCFVMSKSKANQACLITAVSFFKYYQSINSNDSWNGNYIPFKQYVEGFGEILVIDLNKKVEKGN